jgi:fructoselysine-6-phosphate deglycase
MSYSDKSFYLERGERCYAMRLAVEQIADTVCCKGFTSVFFVGAGGSLMMLEPFAYLFRRLSDIPAYSLESAEVATAGFQSLKPGALVVLVTLNGTAETAEVAQFCQDRNIDLVAFVGVPDCPVAKLATYTIFSDEKIGALRYMQLYFFACRVLYNLGFFPEYARFADELKALPAALFQAGQDYYALGERMAGKLSRENFLLWVSSGMAYGETFRFATCCIEEMIWIKTQTIHSAEFFHGCFEIVDRDQCVVLVKNEDSNRALEERVERFLERFCKNYFVVDTRSTALLGISPEFRPLVQPAVINAVFRSRMQDSLQELTGRSAETRRYYGVVDY